jgi:hypothetical protein
MPLRVLCKLQMGWVTNFGGVTLSHAALHSITLGRHCFQQNSTTNTSNMSTKVISDYTLRSCTRAAMATATTRGESPVISSVKTHQGDRSLSDSEVYTRVAGRDRRTYSNVVHSDVTAVDQRDI